MIICADDFGLAPDIDEAIITLARAGKISAVSVMAALPSTQEQTLSPLINLGDKVDLGLHLVFTKTEGLAQSYPSFQGLLARCWLGLLSFESARAKIAEQYDLFTAKTGRPPDFIDGHMHIQQFPIIRQALIEFTNKLPGEKPYIRNSYMPLEAINRQGVSPFKTWLLSIPGGRMKRLLNEAKIPTNEGFTGIYDFSQYQRYPEFLARFLDAPAQPTRLLMVHPGKGDLWRLGEYNALSRQEGLASMANRFPKALKTETP